MHDFDLTIRPATPYDDAAIEQIAQFDSARPPAAPVLVAEVAGDVVAAISLSTGSVVADPFRHTAKAVRMLRLRRDQLVNPSDDPERRPPRWRAALKQA
jgi:hypothetical protein